MTIPCPRAECDEPTSDGLLCSTDASRLRRTLRSLPGLIVNLDEAITKQARIVDKNRVRRSRRSGSPVPYDERLDGIRQRAVETVVPWVRDLAESHGEQTPIADLRTTEAWQVVCDWLRDRMFRIRGAQDVGHLYDKLTYTEREITRAVDLPPDRVYLCACAICGKGVFAPEHKAEIECQHCRRVVEEAGGEGYVPVYSRAEEDARRLDALRGSLVCFDDVRLAVETLQKISLNPKTMRSWIDRGMLPERGRDATGSALYSVGDALSLASRVGVEQGRSKGRFAAKTR